MTKKPYTFRQYLNMNGYNRYLAKQKEKQIMQKQQKDLLFINRIGIELEGGWDNEVNCGDRHGDGSLSKNLGPIMGEISSPPMTLDELRPYVIKKVPTKIDSSCGLHVHCSFKDISSYLLLMEAKFQTYFLTVMDDWGKTMKFSTDHLYWHRLRGENSFCKKLFIPEQQVLAKSKGQAERQTQLNYCYGVHTTIECRLFPGFSNAETVISAVETLVDCYESYLTCNKSSLTTYFEDVLSEDDLLEIS